MTQVKEKIEPDLSGIEKAIMGPEKLPAAKSFAPPTQRGIHELISDIDDLVATLQERVDNVKKRLSEFDRLQSSFYNGQKP
jgi:hypothetical protein